MLTLPLTTAERKLFERSLYTGYQLKVTVQLLDLNHKYIADLSSRFIDGQVNIAGDADVTRNATLTLIDPDNSIGFDTDSPADGTLYADRMIRIVYSVYSDLLPKWVDVPLFCGPVKSVSRDDALVSVEAQGKESLLLPPTVAWYSHKYGKGWTVPSLVKAILRDKGGETKFDFPEWSAKTTREYSLSAESVIWTFCKAIVGPLKARQLFYDGRGVAKLRTTPQKSVFTFTENMLTSKPKVSFDTTGIRNSVMVKGGTPKGKPQIIVRKGAPKSHPVSSWRLGRNGIQNIMLEVVEDDTLVTAKAASERADEVMSSILLENVSVEFESFVIPHLEPEDIYTLTTRDFSVTQRVKEVSIPLKAGQGMSVGYTSKRSINIGKIRSKK